VVEGCPCDKPVTVTLLVDLFRHIFMELIDFLIQIGDLKLEGDKLSTKSELYKLLKSSYVKLGLQFLDDAPALPTDILILSNHTLGVLRASQPLKQYRDIGIL
jgi:hypothetical protein